ncbi:hypothetical protein GOV09_06625 [Candidatus Woesearchaeota archaeon]|nr:hypothetical protein [Candidatus Woesearchaeota archaeon]
MLEKIIHTGEVLVVMLAGGPGTRLGPLTWYRAKPGVPFGPSILGAFATSNAINSNMRSIVLATQYQPRRIEEFFAHVHRANFGPGQGIDVVPPSFGIGKNYRGTADAMYQALLTVLERKPRRILGISGNAAAPKLVLSLSGDHVYQNDFTEMLKLYNSFKNKDNFVISARDVSVDQQHRFGMLKHNGSRIQQFVEKPEEPIENALASEGIYLGPLDVWLDMLRTDQNKMHFDGPRKEMDPLAQTKYDIGGDVIPHALATGKKTGIVLRVHENRQYWEDVGEPHSYHKAAMDVFIREDPALFNDQNWSIEAIGDGYIHRVVTEKGVYSSSGNVRLSKSELTDVVVSGDTVIDDSNVYNTIVMGGTHRKTEIYKAIIRNAIVDERVTIGAGSKVTAPDGNLVIIAEGTVVNPDTKIEANHDAIVATRDAMKSKLANIIEYRKRVSPNVELYLPNGEQIDIASLQAA